MAESEKEDKLVPGRPAATPSDRPSKPKEPDDFDVGTVRMSPMQVRPLLPTKKMAPLSKAPPADIPLTKKMPAIAKPTTITADTDLNAGKAAAPSPSSPGIRDTTVGVPSSLSAIPTVGDRIGKYVVDRVIGSGGMGLVVSARHEALNDNVAIKLLRPKAAGDKIHAERFAREARAIIKIKSEHVVRVLDAGTLETGAPFIVMEYLVGRDLAQILREEGPMDYTRAADLMLQVCEAVASAHAVGVVHRDLKPSNFFVTQRTDGSTLLKVLDFGISKAMGQEGMVDPNLTETQAVFGSPTYMSPEQIRSAKHVDHRSDIWSLGVCLYEVITGKLPFAADNVAGLLASIVADPPFFPRAFVAGLPEGLEELLLHCLMKDARQRVQTVADLAFRLALFATPNVETHTLIDRIDRLARAMGQATTTGPRLPLPLPGPMGSLSQTRPPPMTSSGPHSQPGLLASRSSGVNFGHTGMDLSAEAPPARKSSTAGAIAVGIGVAVALIAGGFGAYQLGVHRAPPAAAPPSAEPTATPAPPVASSAPPAESALVPPPLADSAAVPAAKASATLPSSKKPLPKHPTPRPPTPPPGPKPVDPTNDRF